MRYTKADVIFVAVFSAPIVLVVSLFGLSSISWATNQSRVAAQAQKLISETTDEISPTLESILVSKQLSHDEQQVRQSDQAKWDELLQAFHFVLTQVVTRMDAEEEGLTDRIVPPGSSNDLTRKLSQTLDRASPLMKQLDHLLESSDTSLTDAMKERNQYAGVAQGHLENVLIYAAYRVCHFDLWQSIAANDQDRAFRSIKRLFNLVVRHPHGVNSIFSSQSTLTHVRESLVFEFWDQRRLQQIHRLLNESIDFSEVVQRHDLTKALLVTSALPDVKKLKQLRWLAPYLRLSSGSMTFERRMLSPSEMLRILELLSPETNSSNPAGYDDPFYFDRWLNLRGMQTFELNSRWIPQKSYCQSSAESVEKDRVFTRAAVALRMIYLQTGSYPGSLDQLTTLGWSEVEITEATKLLEWKNDPDKSESTLTATYAEWMKDANGQIIDGGFLKEVRFKRNLISATRETVRRMRAKE